LGFVSAAFPNCNRAGVHAQQPEHQKIDALESAGSKAWFTFSERAKSLLVVLVIQSEDQNKLS
jgi:hypothetical protein